jgi:hypothetical protein
MNELASGTGLASEPEGPGGLPSRGIDISYIIKGLCNREGFYKKIYLIVESIE